MGPRNEIIRTYRSREKCSWNRATLGVQYYLRLVLYVLLGVRLNVKVDIHKPISFRYDTRNLFDAI